MILVDTSVWIDFLNREETEQTEKLRRTGMQERLLVGDLVLFEILQGAQNDAHAGRLDLALREFQFVNLLDFEVATSAARNFRKLRGLGITVRKMADLIIGTFCIERRHVLLHDDRDFDLMEKHLGLRVL